VAFLVIRDYRKISEFREINDRLGNKSTPRNQVNLLNDHAFAYYEGFLLCQRGRI